MTPKLHARVMREIISPTVAGMAADGIPFSGFLYAGLMIDRDGNPKTLEFNCRMGDPETQPIMARLKSDFLTVCEHAVSGTLDKVELEWDRRTALCVVMAAQGYPDAPQSGASINGIPDESEEAIVFQAGTRQTEAKLEVTGGRVLGVTALGGQRQGGPEARLRTGRIDPLRGRSMAPRHRLARAPETQLAMLDTGSAALVSGYLKGLHQRITTALEQADGGKFANDPWTKPDDAALGGHGFTSILENGALFERAGVGFSHVTGKQLPPSASGTRPELAGRSFEALGVSLVLHPRNPYLPTVHMNVRFFIARAAGQTDIWWFGGGMDMTPYYGFEEDAIHFHRACKDALDPFGPHCYPDFKARCDSYFYLKHRSEARGIGGIFFDDWNEAGFERSFALQQSVGDAFLGAYLPIIERRRALPYGPAERAWQELRRGRYVEFNLVYDRGTLFGLQSGGRTESILMSMPPVVAWRYNVKPAPGSPEEQLISHFLVPRT